MRSYVMLFLWLSSFYSVYNALMFYSTYNDVWCLSHILLIYLHVLNMNTDIRCARLLYHAQRHTRNNLPQVRNGILCLLKSNIRYGVCSPPPPLQARREDGRCRHLLRLL